jgi:hypothetical protein
VEDGHSLVCGQSTAYTTALHLKNPGRPLAKPLFLHLGFHKTASTYVQTTIELNRDSVLQAFHVVNRARHETRNLKIALVLYGKMPNGARRDAAAAECVRIVEQFEASGKGKLLLSEEVLLGPMLRQAGEMGLYSTLESKMALLIECFAPYELHFLFYIREQAAWLRSLYNQAVKQVRFAGSFEAFLHGVDSSDVWGVLRRRIGAAAGDREVHFFPLEQDAKTPFGAGDRLFRYIGLSEDERARMIKPPEPVNASWPESLLELMHILNVSELDDRSLAIVRDTLKKNLRLFSP